SLRSQYGHGHAHGGMELNMNETTTLTLVDYWQIAVRRKWLIVSVILLSVGVAGLLCVVLPKRYRSSTLILVADEKILEQYVTAKLTSQFIEENLRVREQLVEGATEFLEQELRLAKDRLEQQEQLISGFKTKYMGELPQQTDANLHALDRLQTDLIAVTENIH